MATWGDEEVARRRLRLFPRRQNKDGFVVRGDRRRVESDGYKVGELAGQARLVAILQGLADEPVEPMDELQGLVSARLMAMETDLQRRLRERS